MQCETCKSDNICEEVRFIRGLRDDKWSKWKQVYRRCADCGCVKIYTEEGWQDVR